MHFKELVVKKLLVTLAYLPMSVFSQDINGADTAWIMTSTALVLLMTLPGLALFYGGLVRTKNILSVLMQCFTIAGIVSILWFVVGYSIAFSGDSPYFGDFSNILLMKVSINMINNSIPESLFVMFQMTFAIITPALIIGGYAERMKFSAVLLFSSIWLLVVYAPITHWVWGGGWLGNMLDYAGGTVVHITAGIAALVAAIVLGPRKGFLKRPIPPHNMTMTITGAAMLWVGWFGFNGGSALAVGGNAAMAILVTHISAATGAITWMFYEWIKFGRPTALGTVTGMVAGLGTITPASGFVGPVGALVIGFIAGIVCFNAVIIIKQKFKIDDSLDVFPVHGVGGIMGTLMVGFFASKELGIFSGQGGWDHEAILIYEQLQIQFIGVVATVIYTAIATYLILKIVNVITGLRVSEEEEQQGLDIISHEEKGYDL
ncbi:ammonium transporter [Candidatus Vesicomyidisocius calyptogenae]|uniref:Ammonium transporter n=2 Tax=Vesicomyosocius okutanii subsp. Calyptogena okutanii (strain HA) TaxID=412965 RepID=A5CXB5_VESOH|nr:ammonium transporter [Candidatus Vesicomyosocius okutanii]